ncbi:MAG: methylase [Gammaproteobacteria bacterium HGW-Gammaproteobacteria-1]|jgi:cyclopropane fatty-acyl-phospholipid synthase-like methyltransferase|nr:MAG: methylase [Gammaproteobacteria bacterium HGW-Gammaproteobacteria-1]
MKPIAESCLQNRAPILAVLREVLAGRRRLLEIGSGTGQHAVYFAPELPHLLWQTSDLEENHAAIQAWLAEADSPNLLPPLPLDVRTGPWPADTVDAVFSANTAHIMGWDAVEAMFAGVGRLLEAEGVFALYGPFNYGGAYTADSNARFDAWLRQRDPASGVRDFEALDALARAAGLVLWQDYAMPADNRTLVWRKGSAGFNGPA